MRRNRTVLVVASLALCAAVAVAVVVVRRVSDRPATGENIEPGTLRSSILGEDRPFVVYLPESYRREPERRYPVAYVLDGDEQLAHTAEAAATLARMGVAPELLVVGAPPLDGKGRQRDYTPPGMRQDIDEAASAEGRADRFLAFLERDLVPRIEGSYRTAPPRILAGNSRGGLFVVYSLIAAPALFDARFAFSPALWRDDAAILAQLDRSLATSPPPASFLYLSLGERENAQMTGAFERAVSLLRERAPQSLRWHSEITHGAAHGDNARLSTPVALHRLFQEENAGPH
jgi:predicted alpha/beta superfamily hydrolase